MPKFTVETAALRQKVNFVRQALGSSKTDLSVVLMRLRVEGNKAYLFAATKELYASASFRVDRPDGDADGVCALLGSKLEKLATETQAEKLDVEWDNENFKAIAGFLTVNFECYDDATVRSVEEAVKPNAEIQGSIVPREALEEGLSCARSCSTSNALRPDVNHVEMRKGRLLSSDGRKIMVFTHSNFKDEQQLKVPVGVLGKVLSAVKNVDNQNLEIAQADSYYILKANRGEYVLGIRKTERNFPAVEGMILNDAKPADEIAIDKHVLEAQLRGVSMGLSSDEVKVTLKATGQKREAYLEVSALNSLGRKSFEKAQIGRKLEGDEAIDIAFPISFKHMLDTLSVFKGDSVVDLFVLTAQNLLMVKDKVEGSREVLTIIPFRTDQQIEDERKEAERLAEERKKQTEAEKVESAEAGELASEAIGELEDQTEDLDLSGDVAGPTAEAAAPAEERELEDEVQLD